jgi:protein-S-isoprenylcysteine O-methyltransferase Ste14
MSNTSPVRLVRWLLINLVVAAVLCAVSGRYSDPWLWAYVATVALVSLYPALALSEDLAKERFSPPEGGADRTPLVAIRLLALGHIVVSALDARWEITHVPDALRVVGLAGLALSVTLVFRAMMANHYFSAVIRIQSERGHRVIDQGVYGIIRHPGYAGMIPSMPLSGLALGSWVGFAIGLAYALMMLRRVRFEDAFLRSHLEGYHDYTGRVRYRLIPGVW